MRVFIFVLILSSIVMAKEKFELKGLKDIITNDFLEEEARKRNALATEEDRLREEKRLMKLRFPQGEVFWKFLSEIWLVKNAALLKWDIKTPNYGLEENISKLFKALGIYEKKFKIILADTPSIPHMYLPTDGEVLYILSVPFLRALDLTKLEISMLILEDYIRSENKYIENFITIDSKKISKGFVSKKETNDILNKNLTQISDFAFKKGYDFQSQFELTKKMDQLLKPTPVYWKIYLDYLKKVDGKSIG
jgi:hypothetical protein